MGTLSALNWWSMLGSLKKRRTPRMGGWRKAAQRREEGNHLSGIYSVVLTLPAAGCTSGRLGAARAVSLLYLVPANGHDLV